jgi:DNA repair exonuclease SbcCD nuclease subunit
MRIGFIGDTHLGCTDYSQKRRSDFSLAFSNAINICRDNTAELICLLGDVFDSAATRRNVDAFATLIGEISPALDGLDRSKVPVVAIPGNHEFGRGREAGELSVLEHLGFVQVLRCSHLDIGSVRIHGIPWQHSAEEFTHAVSAMDVKDRRKSHLLLMHNFVRGTRHIPTQLGEIDVDQLHAFTKVFVGHHHVHESIANCVIPGSTEVQNLLDKSEKGVVLYDTDQDKSDWHPLPRTHEVLIYRFDCSSRSASEIIHDLETELDGAGGCDSAFVYVDVIGTANASQAISKAEIAACLRARNVFDYCVEFHFSTRSRSAAATRRGASIETIIKKEFEGKELTKARIYLSYGESEELFSDIREKILSGN